MTKAQLLQIAASLHSARIKGKARNPITQEFSSFSLSDAYAVSEINLKNRLEQEKGFVIGKKIGLTSRAVQKQLGVEEPDFGFLTSDMNIPVGEKVKAPLILPKVEGEVAFVLKRDLLGPGITAAQVIQCTDFILPCIEIIDSRIENWNIKIQDTVADNASSAYFVLGNKPTKLSSLDLRMAGMALRVNGEVLSTGAGAACLDHPVNAVAWLANTLGKFGIALQRGEIILSGAFGPVVPVRAGDKVEVQIAGLGAVDCLF